MLQCPEYRIKRRQEQCKSCLRFLLGLQLHGGDQLRKALAKLGRVCYNDSISEIAWHEW